MNDKRSQFSIMSDISDTTNDKRPFALHEQSWYKTALLKRHGIPLLYVYFHENKIDALK